MTKRTKVKSQQNYAKTNQANENITASKSRQNTRNVSHKGGVDRAQEGATNAALNRHQLGIKLLFFAIDFGIVCLSFVAPSWQHDNLFSVRNTGTWPGPAQILGILTSIYPAAGRVHLPFSPHFYSTNNLRNAIR